MSRTASSTSSRRAPTRIFTFQGAIVRAVGHSLQRLSWFLQWCLDFRDTTITSARHKTTLVMPCSDQHDKRLKHFHKELEEMLYGDKESDDFAKGVLKVLAACRLLLAACGFLPTPNAEIAVCWRIAQKLSPRLAQQPCATFAES